MIVNKILILFEDNSVRSLFEKFNNFLFENDLRRVMINWELLDWHFIVFLSFCGHKATCKSLFDQSPALHTSLLGRACSNSDFVKTNPQVWIFNQRSVAIAFYLPKSLMLNLFQSCCLATLSFVYLSLRPKALLYYY